MFGTHFERKTTRQRRRYTARKEPVILEKRSDRGIATAKKSFLDKRTEEQKDTAASGNWFNEDKAASKRV